jgi:hypothetical protein
MGTLRGPWRRLYRNRDRRKISLLPSATRSEGNAQRVFPRRQLGIQRRELGAGPPNAVYRVSGARVPGASGYDMIKCPWPFEGRMLQRLLINGNKFAVAGTQFVSKVTIRRKASHWIRRAPEFSVDHKVAYAGRERLHGNRGRNATNGDLLVEQVRGEYGTAGRSGCHQERDDCNLQHRVSHIETP